MYLLVDIVNIILDFVRHHCLFHMTTTIRKQDLFSLPEEKWGRDSDLAV